MIGELSGLACAFLWSLSAVMLRTEEEKIDVFSLNALRLIPAALMFLALLVFSGNVMELARVSSSVVLVLVSSVIIGLAIGDTAFFRSMYLIGVSRSLPITNAYPLFTLLLAFIFLGELPTLASFAGVVLIAIGVSIIALGSERDKGPELFRNRRAKLIGIALAFVAALAWAASTTLLKVGMANLDVIAVNSIRLPIASLIMVTVASVRGNFRVMTYGRKSLFNVAGAGILGAGLGGLAFLASVQLAGAAEAAALSSAAPLFGVPLEFLVLKEKITGRIVLGTVLSVAGVWLLF